LAEKRNSMLVRGKKARIEVASRRSMNKGNYSKSLEKTAPEHLTKAGLTV